MSLIIDMKKKLKISTQNNSFFSHQWDISELKSDYLPLVTRAKQEHFAAAGKISPEECRRKMRESLGMHLQYCTFSLMSSSHSPVFYTLSQYRHNMPASPYFAAPVCTIRVFSSFRMTEFILDLAFFSNDEKKRASTIPKNSKIDIYLSNFKESPTFTSIISSFFFYWHTNQYVVEADISFQLGSTMFKLDDGNLSSGNGNDLFQLLVLLQHSTDFFDDLQEVETLHNRVNLKLNFLKICIQFKAGSILLSWKSRIL